MPRLRRCLLCLLAVILGLATAWLFWSHTAITQENYARIRTGMPLKAVEEILGPPRDESTVNLAALFDWLDAGSGDRQDRLAEFDSRFAFASRATARVWSSNELIVQVVFDDDDRVVAAESLAVQRASEPVATIRRWLHF